MIYKHLVARGKKETAKPETMEEMQEYLCDELGRELIADIDSDAFTAALTGHGVVHKAFESFLTDKGMSFVSELGWLDFGCCCAAVNASVVSIVTSDDQMMMFKIADPQCFQKALEYIKDAIDRIGVGTVSDEIVPRRKFKVDWSLENNDGSS